MTTKQEAIDDMSALFKAVWDPTGNVLIWEDVKGSRPGDDTPWARLVIRHASSGQTSLGGLGSRSFTREGTLIISIFTPTGNGLSDSSVLAKIAEDAYEGVHSPNGVWFRDVNTQELGRDGQMFMTNTLATFEYTEIK